MRRLQEELNIVAELEYVYQFCYQAEFSEAGSENELCHVYLGNVGGDVRPNDSEIESIRFLSSVDLDREFANQPQQFTPWFKQEWRVLQRQYAEPLARYAI